MSAKCPVLGNMVPGFQGGLLQPLGNRLVSLFLFSFQFAEINHLVNGFREFRSGLRDKGMVTKMDVVNVGASAVSDSAGCLTEFLYDRFLSPIGIDSVD
jgi:hypothetical protein